MSDQLQQTEPRTCRFPGCERPAVSADAGTGRPPEYCDTEGHNRAAAWRARRRLAAEPARNVEDEKRPVDAARQRAGELRGQVAGMVEHLGQQLTALVEELRTVADPDAAEAQIESVTTEAAERVAAATARASRAEQAQRKAELERSEADAAATEASDLVEQQQTALAAAQQESEGRVRALEQMTTELAEVRAGAVADSAQAQSELAQVREELTVVRARAGETEHERDDALTRAEAASVARAEAEERARGAVARADEEASRAQRADVEITKLRDQVEEVRLAQEVSREEANTLRGTLAAAAFELKAARADVEREQVHGEQRVNDLRTTQDQQLTQLRDELVELRQDAREQRSRADRAEARLAITGKSAPGSKPAK